MQVYQRTLLLIFFVLVACSPSASNSDTDAPAGDAERGAALFTESVNGAPACSTCHTLDGTRRAGPSLEGFAAVASDRVEGQAAEEYTRTSITRPAAHIVEGFGNSMYPQYGSTLDSQQVADLVAYLLTL